MADPPDRSGPPGGGASGGGASGGGASSGGASGRGPGSRPSRDPRGARSGRPAPAPSPTDESAERLADLLSRFLKRTGMEARIRQSAVLEEWPRLVGPEIGAVTRALSITEDGTLFVAVRNNAWMAELAMMERELLESVNRVTGDKPILRLRWQLMR